MTKMATISRRAVNSALIGALAAGCVPLQPEVDDKPLNSGGSAAATTPPQAAVPATPTPPAVTPSPPPPILSFSEAVEHAARAVLTQAPAPEMTPAVVVIDPLVDGVTGYQSSATQIIQDHIVRLITKDFPQYAVQSITSQSLRQQPRFLIGTFTPINADLKPAGQRESYWFCLVMGDLKTGKIIAKSVARVRMEDVNATPVAAFGDSPIWTEDPSIQAYVSTCKGSKVGDPIKPEYLDGLLTAALVCEAGNAYNEGQNAEALDLYKTARQTPAGEQLRVYCGIYLSLTRLGRAQEAESAFGELVDYGLRKKRLAVKFVFRAGSVRLASDGTSGDYGMWIEVIAERVASSNICLQVTGHTSPTGPAAFNDQLSLLRAEYIQSRLESDQALLKKRILAAGVGSRENLVGTGRDDTSDMLDRRVELKPIGACA
jgi:hypothetical protein